MIIEFLGFSLGAGLAIRGVTALNDGLRPLSRGVLKTGAALVSRAGAVGRPRSDEDSAGDVAPRQIVIAHE